MRDDLKLVNGNLSYHLLVLQRLELIESIKYGRVRRYYAKGKHPSIRKGELLGGTEERILRELVERGPMTNTEIAKGIGISKQRCSYNLRLLRVKGLIEETSSGWNVTITKELETFSPQRGE